MSDYYDSKGVRHSSEFARDSANRRYLSEERDARDKQTDLLQQQARLQAEQLRLAEQGKREQRAHNERVEALARKEAAEAQAQREFTKDVQWLERSDAKGRFEYLLRKRHSDIVESLAGLAFAKSSLEQSPVAPQLRGELRSTLTEYCDASLAYLNTVSELDRIKKGLASAKKAEGAGSLAVLWALGGAVLLFICIAGIIAGIQSIAEGKRTVGSLVEELLVALLLFGGGGLAMFGKYAAASKKAKLANAQNAELTPLKGQVQKRLETCQKERLQKRDVARTVYESWHEETAAALGATVQNAIRDRFVSERLKALIGEIETEYPPLLRVDWSALDSEFLAGSANELADDILQSAVGEYVTPDLLVVQLEASDEGQLSTKLRSNPSLLDEVAGGNEA